MSNSDALNADMTSRLSLNWACRAFIVPAASDSSFIVGADAMLTRRCREALASVRRPDVCAWADARETA